MAAVPSPMLYRNYQSSVETAILRKRFDASGDTYSGLCENQKGKIIEIVKTRQKIFQYLSSVLQGKVEWMNVEKIHRDRWKMAYLPERGKTSYFKIGYSLGNYISNSPELAMEFLADVLAIIQYFEYIDGININNKGKEKEKDKKKRNNLPLFFTNNAINSVNGQVNNTNHDNKKNDKKNSLFSEFRFSSLFKSKRFQKKFLKKSTSQSSLTTLTNDTTRHHSPRLSKDQGSLRTITSSGGSIVANSSDSGDSISIASSTTNGKSPLWTTSKWKYLPKSISKNPRILAFIGSLSTPSEHDMLFEPDPYESVLTLIDMLDLVMDELIVRIRKCSSNYVDLLDLSTAVATVDNRIRDLIYGECIRSVDQVMNRGIKRTPAVIEKDIKKNIKD